MTNRRRTCTQRDKTYDGLLKDASTVMELYGGLKPSIRKARNHEFDTEKGIDGKDDIIKGKISYNFTVTLVAGKAQVPVSDAGLASSSLIALGKLFRYYHMNRISIRIIPYTSANAGENLCVSYYPFGEGFAAQPGWGEVESEHLVTQSQYATVEKELVVPNKALNPQHEWFATTTDSIEPNADIMGYLAFASGFGTSTSTFYLQATVNYEYCALMDTESIGAFLETR